MRKQIGVVISALEQSQAFLDQHDDVLHAVNATDTRKALDDVLARLSVKIADRNAWTRLSAGAHADAEQARDVLIDHHMRGVIRVAKASLPAHPELAGLAAAAPSRVATKALIESARGMLESVATHRDIFAGPLGADFYDALLAATNEFEAAAKLGPSSRAQRTAATQAMGDQASRGRKVLKILDVLVARALVGKTELWQEWETRRKIMAIAHSTAIPATTAMPATPPTAAAQAPAAEK